MDLFCFASNTERNIWLGWQARKWAVATVSASAMKGRITKAERYFAPGASGLLYCKETNSFTTPFIVDSYADPEEVVTDIWPEPWRLPFSIRPLGRPDRQLHMDEAKQRWPVLRQSVQASVSAAMNITGTTVFVPKSITEEDWTVILRDLAPGSE